MSVLYLIGQIFLWMSLAALLGVLVGWLAAGVAAGRRMVDAEDKWRLRLDRADMQLKALREELAELRGRGGGFAGDPVAAEAGEAGEDDETHRRRLAELAAASRARIQRAEEAAESAQAEIERLRAESESARSEVDDLVNQLQQARRELDLRDRQIDDLRQGAVGAVAGLSGQGAGNGNGHGHDIGAIVPSIRGAALDAGSLRRRGGARATVPLPAQMVLPESPEDPDDLKLIYGIGPTLESRLNALGIYTFRQIASWDDEMIERVADNLHAFPDRIRYDNWVDVAREQHLRKYGERL